MKICIRCHKEKTIKHFKFRTDTGKFRNTCNECYLDWRRIYQKVNKDILQDKSKQYYKINKKRILKRVKTYKIKNKKNISEYNKIYYDANKKNINDLHKFYYINNKEKTKERSRRRRAKLKSITEHYTHEDKLITQKIFDNKCFNCNSKERLCIDHHQCLNKGNPLTITNAVLLCKSCNSSKHTKSPKDFYTKSQIRKLKKLFIKAKQLKKEEKVCKKLRLSK